MSRSGITPVVAVVLLLLLSVTAAGSAYAWITTTTQQAQTATSDALATRLEVKDVACGRGSVRLSLSNVGDRAIDAAEAELLVFDGSGDLVATRQDLDLSDLSLGPGSFDSATFLVPAVLTGGTRYRVELSFPVEGYSVEGSCLPRTGANDPAGVWTFDREPAHRPIIGYDDVPHIYQVENFENGSFGPLRSFGSSYSKENDGGVAMADFTRSGAYDILFYGESHNIYSWADLGGSVPSDSPVQVASLGGSKAQGFAPGDWDEDGDFDVIENRDGDYLENFGNGSWGTYDLPFSGDRGVTGADFDRDSCEDVVHDSSSSDIIFRAGRCNGTFESGSTVITTHGSSNYITAGDFDGDGYQDLVVVTQGNGDGDASLWTGDGTGSFSLANGNFTSFSDGNHRNPRASDIDRDGDPDLVLAEHNGDNLWYVEGNGDGTFGAATKIGNTDASALGIAAPSREYARDVVADHHAKLVGPSNRTAGRVDRGMRFDGQDDYVEASDWDFFGGDGDTEWVGGAGRENWTVTAWIKPTTVSTGNCEDKFTGGDIVAQGGLSNDIFYFHVCEGDRVALYIDGASVQVTSPAGTISAGEWYHVAVTGDQESGTRLYVDGELVDANRTSYAMTGSNSPVRIGGEAVRESWFEGVIDEVQIYPAALR